MSKPPKRLPQQRPPTPDLQQQILVHQQQSVRKFSGPIPPPETVEAYDRIYPGAAQIIIGMSQKEQDSRLAITERTANENIAYAKRGQWMAFSLAIFAMLTGLAAAYMGHPILAGTIFGTVVLGVVAAFLAPRIAKKDPAKS